MRVIAGIAKKRRLKSPGKLPVRPTSDRVKESLFNIINPLLPGSSFADLYAGTGGVGIEALSRGARKVVFVEKNAHVLRILKDNIGLSGLTEGAEVICRDVVATLKQMFNRGDCFNIIFADPPYRQGLAAETLNTISKFSNLLHPEGLLIVEIGADESVPDKKGNLTLIRREKYGDTVILFYKPSVEGDQFCE